MIRTLLFLTPHENSAGAVEDVYARNDVLAFSLRESGALSSELSVADDGSGEVLVTATWPDGATYDEWLAHPERGSIAPDLSGLVEQVGVGRRFVVRQRVERVEHEVVRVVPAAPARDRAPNGIPPQDDM